MQPFTQVKYSNDASQQVARLLQETKPAFTKRCTATEPLSNRSSGIKTCLQSAELLSSAHNFVVRLCYFRSDPKVHNEIGLRSIQIRNLLFKKKRHFFPSAKKKLTCPLPPKEIVFSSASFAALLLEKGQKTFLSKRRDFACCKT